MDIVLVTSISGSTLFILICLANVLWKKQLDIQWNYIMLKTALLLYLVPLGWINAFVLYLFPDLGYRCFRSVSEKYAGYDSIIAFIPDGFYFNSSLRWEIVLTGFWLFMTAILFLKWIFDYGRFKKAILASAEEITAHEVMDLVECYKAELQIHKTIKIFSIKGNRKTYTTGIWKPIVILSENLGTENRRLALKHELVHIKNQDTLVRFLRRLAICFNWFNPLIFFLDKRLEHFSEYNCDYMVVEKFNIEEKKQYGRLIIEAAENNTSFHNSFISPFTIDKKIVKARLDSIMNHTKRKTGLLSGILAVCMIVFSSFTTLAYQVPRKIEVGGSIQEEDIKILDNDDNFIKFEAEGELTQLETYPMIYECQFTTEDGGIYNAEPGDGVYGNCDHVFVNGEYSSHVNTVDGRCTIKFYDAKSCTECNLVLTGDLIRTLAYEKCPH